ncbi:hypothetical protein [Nesterenkonia ebinurensis]|uniref:hypothetical protein n=1 Tax=Nesterenkonia ebinurensis TaxID=2608252 RepID=UPI00123E0DA0|nr:hypothetical protein [Nesterenkonia ebinurensis]
MEVWLSWQLLSALIAGIAAGTGISELSLRRRLKIRDQWWIRFEKAIDLIRTKEREALVLGVMIIDDIGGAEKPDSAWERRLTDHRRRFVRTPEDSQFIRRVYFEISDLTTPSTDEIAPEEA